jgi:hypothetical protein
MPNKAIKKNFDYLMCIQIRNHIDNIKKIQRYTKKRFGINGTIPSLELTNLIEDASNIYMDFSDEIIEMKIFNKH